MKQSELPGQRDVNVTTRRIHANENLATGLGTVTREVHGGTCAPTADLMG